MKTNKEILDKDTIRSKSFVKILDSNKEFTIVLKKFVYEDEYGFKTAYYFQPSFVLNYTEDKIVRKDILWEKDSVVGWDSEGFILANQEDFEKYCKECFEDFRNSLCLNPFATIQEPEYTDKEICDLEFHSN